MALVRIDCDEWYPVYEVVRDRGNIDVDEDCLAWWQRAKDDFLAAQGNMREAEQHAGNRRGDADADGNRIFPKWPA